MAFSIKNPEADRLARQSSRVTGLSLTDAILKALREQLKRETGRSQVRGLADELRAISDRCAALPDLDLRTPEDILDFDERGLPR